ncbi:MAG: hypothetical protein JW822_05410 [Spirochaetales bacterium]|nr:hypothetical protein [Spirochaetales bacterium]
MQTLFQKKNKRIKKTPIIIGLLFLLCYFFMFSSPLQKELRIHLQWVIDLSDPSVTETATAAGKDLASAQAFSLGNQPGDYFGYFDDDGNIIFLKQIEERNDIPFRVALSDRGFIYYSSSYVDLIFSDREGEEKKTYNDPGPGFPLLSQDGARVFILKTDLSGLREIDSSGEVLWSADVPSWITSFDYTDNLVMCGLGDGTVNIFDKQGNTAAAFPVQQGAVDCIYGVAFSEQNELYAGVAGAEPQFLFLGELNAQDKPAPSLIKLDSDFRREVRIEFSGHGELLFFEGEKALKVFDVSSKELSTFPLLGDIKSFDYIERVGIMAVVSAQNNFNEIVILMPGRSFLFKDYFNGQKIFLTSVHNRLFFGIDHKIIRLDLVEE